MVILTGLLIIEEPEIHRNNSGKKKGGSGFQVPALKNGLCGYIYKIIQIQIINNYFFLYKTIVN